MDRLLTDTFAEQRIVRRGPADAAGLTDLTTPARAVVGVVKSRGWRDGAAYADRPQTRPRSRGLRPRRRGLSSITVPKMMLASSCGPHPAWRSIVGSPNRPRSPPPAIEIGTPAGTSIDASSSGELIADSAVCGPGPSLAELMPISGCRHRS